VLLSSLKAFESVIPSERTRLSLRIIEGSIRVLAPTHPGALLLHVGDLDFSTELVGDSPEASFRIVIPALSLLFLDNITGSGREDEQPQAWGASGGIHPWKVWSMIN
jgi:autophagy-related protein 2